MRQYTWMLGTFALATLVGNAAGQVIVFDNFSVPLVNPIVNFDLNGGAANQAGNTITRLVADDCHLIAAAAGAQVSQYRWIVVNSNSVNVAAQMRLRFWADDGPGGLPGTLINSTNISQFNFNANTAFSFSSSPAAGSFIVPADAVIWAGITFDDNSGVSGATPAQLNNLGMTMFNPPSVGTSTDNVFTTTAAGSFAADLPAGGLNNFGGSPVANLDWQFSVTAVPEPSSLLLTVFAIGGGLLRRRRVNVSAV